MKIDCKEIRGTVRRIQREQIVVPEQEDSIARHLEFTDEMVDSLVAILDEADVDQEKVMRRFKHGDDDGLAGVTANI